MSYDVFTGILKMMDEFQGTNAKIDFEYYHDDIASKILKEKYHIDEIAGTGNTVYRAINLLDWLSSHTYHFGNYDNHVTKNALDLLEYSYDKELEHGINCRSLSITLAECCLAVGLYARAVYLMPFSPYDGDSHVVCEVYIPENNKWIMLDPTYNGYVMDENDNIYSVLELRHALANRCKLKFCDKFNYNGDFNIDFKDINEYYAKDLFYLQCRRIHTYNSEELSGNPTIIFAPVGYDVKKSIIANIEYRIKAYGRNERLEKLRRSIEKDNAIYADASELERAPF